MSPYTGYLRLRRYLSRLQIARRLISLGLLRSVNLLRRLDTWLLRLHPADVRVREEFNLLASRGCGEGMKQDHIVLTERVVAKMNLSPDDRILDLACGNGWASRLMAANCARSCSVVGLDISDKMVQHARSMSTQFKNLTFLCGAAEHIPCQDQFFTKVLCVESFILFRQTETLKELLRVVAPGGRIFILTSTYKDRDDWLHLTRRLGWESRTGMSVHVFSAAEYSLMLGAAGWTDVQTQELFDESATHPRHSRALVISAQR